MHVKLGLMYLGVLRKAIIFKSLDRIQLDATHLIFGGQSLKVLCSGLDASLLENVIRPADEQCCGVRGQAFFFLDNYCCGVRGIRQACLVRSSPEEVGKTISMYTPNFMENVIRPADEDCCGIRQACLVHSSPEEVLSSTLFFTHCCPDTSPPARTSIFDSICSNQAFTFLFDSQPAPIPMRVFRFKNCIRTS